jgi:hypothetical protein
LFDAAPDEFGSSRAFVGAAALAVGLLTGFAGGYITGQRNGMAAPPNPRVPAREATPVDTPREVPAQSYTETPVAEPAAPVAEAAAPVAQAVTPVATAEVSRPRVPRAAMTRPIFSSGTGALFVLSRPSGAQVFLDERLVGTTPLSLSDVAAGTHAVQITLPGHQRWTTAVSVRGGESARVAASLEP